MNRYPIGMMCRIVAANGRYAEFDGLLCVIAARVQGDPGEYEITIENGAIPRPGKRYEAGHENLRPIRDDDANTVTSWADCIWKPEGVAA